MPLVLFTIKVCTLATVIFTDLSLVCTISVHILCFWLLHLKYKVGNNNNHPVLPSGMQRCGWTWSQLWCVSRSNPPSAGWVHMSQTTGEPLHSLPPPGQWVPTSICFFSDSIMLRIFYVAWFQLPCNDFSVQWVIITCLCILVGPSSVCGRMPVFVLQLTS